jgi:hypothetical protein
MGESRQLITDINELLGKDIDIPGRGVGIVLARNSRSWLTQLQRVHTLAQMQQLCASVTIRDPKAPLRLWEHRHALMALLVRHGVKPFSETE